MRLAINTPTRGTDTQTGEALETLAISARRNIPGLEGITVPECLMSLLVPTDLDRLESVLEGAAAAASSAMSAPFSFAAPLSRDRMLGGGLGAWPAGDGGYAAVMAAAGVERVTAKNEEGEEEGAPVGAMVEGPMKTQANELNVFTQLLCRLKVARMRQTC
eukprot:g15431.t1